jgi:hypothetical protein
LYENFKKSSNHQIIKSSNHQATFIAKKLAYELAGDTRLVDLQYKKDHFSDLLVREIIQTFLITIFLYPKKCTYPWMMII